MLSVGYVDREGIPDKKSGFPQFFIENDAFVIIFYVFSPFTLKHVARPVEW